MRWPPPTSRIGPLRMIQILLHLYGLGLETATYLVRELFCRPFRHRRAVAAFAGLTGTAFRSGEWEQGISKIGNPRLRRMVMQLAWRCATPTSSAPGLGFRLSYYTVCQIKS